MSGGSGPKKSPAVIGAAASNGQNMTPTPAPVTPNSSANLQSIMSMIDAAAQQNPLNGFYQSAYHFRLFAATDMDAISAASANGENVSTIADFNNKFCNIQQITIAESGVTGFNIKDVTLETVCGGTAEGRSNAATKIVITVTEANGLSFLDGMYLAARALKVKNYTKVTYYLELTFKGYDAAGNYTSTLADPPSLAGTPQATFSNGGKWIWAIVMVDVAAKLNEGGGVYTMNFQYHAETDRINDGNADMMYTPQPFLASGGTVKELFADYIAKLNEGWKRKAGGDLVIFEGIVTKKIGEFLTGPPEALDKDPGTFVLKSQDPDHEPNRNWKFDRQKGTYSVNVTKGYRIQDFIVDALKHTEDGQKLAVDNGGVKGQVDQSPASVNSRGFRQSIIWTVETVMTQKDFDTVSGNYIKHITFHLIPYPSLQAILSRRQIEQAKDPEVQRGIVNSYLSDGTLRKKYDYVFTGMNTEIIDFDMSFNAKLNFLLPSFTGTQMRYEAYAIPARTVVTGTAINKGATAPTDDATVKDASVTPPTTGPTVAAVPVAPASTPAPFTGSNAKGGRGSGSHANNTVRMPSTNNNTTNVHVAKAKPNPEVSAGTTVAAATGPTNALTAAEIQLVEGGGNTYVEDLLQQYNNPDPNNPPLPISFWQSEVPEVESGMKSAFVGQVNKDQSVVGAIWSQIYRTETGSYNSVKLTIRGDPYWLGQTNIHRNINLKFGHVKLADNDLPDFSTTLPAIMLYFRFPIQMGDDFKPILKNSALFTGLYTVTRITHTFSDGVFKQELQCVINPLGNPATWAATDGTNGGAGSSSQIVQPSGMSPPSGGVVAPGPTGPTGSTGATSGTVALPLPPGWSATYKSGYAGPITIRSASGGSVSGYYPTSLGSGGGTTVNVDGSVTYSDGSKH